ncbi:hypothetical protein O181_006012 [Austropuccinia psidii MF-1]|uniref:Uncharacterized protein n=1 Tax=Austropuccinia psidii MF-1 TaxID=1389203 RepID=A0A9Q3BJ81_9BASI|nr:hypothetical protein [Austropuccinia psidii MF-1]
MTHTLTYNSIQNFQLHHHHVGREIVPYAPAPTQAHTNAPAPTHAHANATAPAALCGGLQPYHPLMLSLFMDTHHLGLVCPSHAHTHTCSIVRQALPVSSAK